MLFQILDTRNEHMITDTEGIVLRQVKAAGGRRMISLFSRKFGKISVGASINEGGRNKTALPARAFSYGRYELFKSRDNYNLNNGQVIKSYYAIGEDLDKYMAASYVLELTDKMLPEEMSQPRIFSLLLEFMEALEKREKKHKTLIMAYIVKILDILGMMPELNSCASCGCDPHQSDGGLICFSIEEGGVICRECADKLLTEGNRPLIYKADFGIIEILKYFRRMPMSAFEKIALNDQTQGTLQEIMKEYISYHMDIKGLKSESFF